MTALVNSIGFSGGYTVIPESGGLSQYRLNTGYTYTSGSPLTWDTLVLTDPSITYSAGTFTAASTGTYLIKMFALVTLGSHSVQSVITSSSMTPTLAMGIIGPGASFPTSNAYLCPFIVDLYLFPGNTFSFSLTILGGGTIPVLGSANNLNSIRFIG